MNRRGRGRGRGRGRRGPKKAMVLPVHMLYNYLVKKRRVHVWLYENKHLRIEGVITGFDEYMNLVMIDSEEMDLKKKTKRKIGKIMLKGENISLVQDLGEN